MAVEAEVPDRCIVDVPPRADAGQKRVHQRELLHLAGIHRGIRVSDHQADVVADDASAIVAELVHALVDPLRGGLHVDAARRDRGVADAWEIDRDDGEARGELDRQRLPHLCGFGVAVQEQHGRSLAADGGAERAALDRHHLLPEAGPVIGGRHCRCQQSDDDRDTIHVGVLSVAQVRASASLIIPRFERVRHVDERHQNGRRVIVLGGPTDAAGARPRRRG